MELVKRPNLELESDGTRMAGVSFGVSLYAASPFTEIPESVLGCYDRCLELIPEEDFSFYLTENMRKHKPVTKRTLNMLRTWLKDGAPPREFVAIQLNDAKEYNSAHSRKFEVFGREEGTIGYEKKRANVLEIALPFSWGEDRSDEMLAFVKDLCERFPFRCGLAGYAFQWSPYWKKASHTHAWAKSMRHRGVDIPYAINDSISVGQDAIRGVGWLTMLDDAFVKKLGGREKMNGRLSKEVDVLDVSGGVILRAGRQSEFGDTNRSDFLPLYKEVYRVVEPLMEPALERFHAFDLRGEQSLEQTREWLTRFADG